MDTFLFLIFPYLCLAVFVVGHYWRYKYDKFGWTTRSSQLYENRLLRWGSPLFHFGLLGVIAGHVIGLVVPKSWTEALGISEEAYHLVAVTGGLIAGAATLVGLVILVYRRRTVGPVFSATTRMDKLMYVFLATVIVLGIWNTLAASTFGHYDYREDVSPWFRSIFLFQPKPELMADAALGFQLHALVAFGLFALWPFTRLVHVFSAPLGYVTRPYIVYRTRDEEREGTRAPKRGWEKVSR
ncbi:respiratory nitrate reductase subunit gamma [Knoellia sp. 3-2P3]|uniref:respiratory nitrate reductase subunit gamma n=1 Tax=unclassified Knoellia TaxID=2618719 RepID=UPI0023DAFC1D|nr:respiratory nitrate reductase subunit gamma [Knoellia sp. 3-2P3]MDF2092132.1 respiratory nitrate reductase subunit gamma [Knoellia sp. 3-2P3]